MVFLRNIDVETDDDDLKEMASQFGEQQSTRLTATTALIERISGPVSLAIMCKSKREGHATGTAFVHFTSKEGADALLEQVSSSSGFVFNGRLLYGHRAVAREEAKEKFAPKPKSFDEKGKDRRNLYLLNESRVRTERESEAKGMSKEDVELRQRLATAAKMKLKTPIMFVSPTRLTVCLDRFIPVNP